MKSILFFTSNYYPEPTANGICVDQIIKELQKKDYEIHLICYKGSNQKESEKLNGVNIHRVTMPVYFQLQQKSKNTTNFFISQVLQKISRIIHRLKLFMYLPFFPMTSIFTTIKFYRKADLLHKTHSFNATISSYNPIEGLIASNLFKKKYGEIKLGMYVLDSLSNTGGGKFLNGKITDFIGWKWEKRLYPRADFILNMKSHKKHHEQNRYNRFRDKIYYVDIPLFKSKDVKENKNINTKSVIVYTGSLDSKIRNPKYACESLKMLNNSDYQINFYSKGDCEVLLEEYEKETQGLINRKGFVPHAQSQESIEKSSFLLNIGNSNSDMIPSKIFEYMSVGKPIIHFYDSIDDSSLPYLEQYPLSLLIKEEKDNIDENKIRIKKFLELNRNKVINPKELEHIFELNKPEYTANIIIDLL